MSGEVPNGPSRRLPSWKARAQLLDRPERLVRFHCVGGGRKEQRGRGGAGLAGGAAIPAPPARAFENDFAASAEQDDAAVPEAGDRVAEGGRPRRRIR
jgi:hypothetical protein